jgi:hypothetical protein
VRPASFAGMVLLPALLATCRAQRSTQPALDEILVQREADLTAYRSTVPDFFADEHVDSVLRQPHQQDIRTSTNSLFRLTRRGQGASALLLESREVKMNNNTVARGVILSGPAIFTGAFSNAIFVVSLQLAHCFDYRLGPEGKLNGVSAIVISYTAWPGSEADKTCPGIASGRAWVDTEKLHLLRVEASIPDHEITAGVIGLWTWSIDYAPVVLDRKIFWMPKTIESLAVADNHRASWSFTASYTNYHKLTATSHIVTGTDGNPPPR